MKVNVADQIKIESEAYLELNKAMERTFLFCDEHNASDNICIAMINALASLGDSTIELKDISIEN